MLDDLGVNHDLKAFAFEGKREGRTLHKLVVVRFQEAKLAEQDIHADGVLEIKDDFARATADIQNGGGITRKLQDDLVPPALPIPLQPYRAIKGSVIIVSGFNRVSESPHVTQCLEVCENKFHMRPLGTTAPVAERYLADAPTFGVNPKQNLLQHIEISGIKWQLLHSIDAIYPEATGKVLVGQRKHTSKRNIKNLAEQPAEPGHLRRTTLHVAGGNQHVSFLA